jgi:hypothetical protein
VWIAECGCFISSFNTFTCDCVAEIGDEGNGKYKSLYHVKVDNCLVAYQSQHGIWGKIEATEDETAESIEPGRIQNKEMAME